MRSLAALIADIQDGVGEKLALYAQRPLLDVRVVWILALDYREKRAAGLRSHCGDGGVGRIQLVRQLGRGRLALRCVDAV